MQEDGEIGRTQEVPGAKAKRRRAVQDEESVVVVKKATSVKNVPVNVSEIIAMLTAPHTSGPRYTIVASQDSKNAWKIAICALDETQAGSGMCTRNGLSILSIDALIACLMPEDTSFPFDGGIHNLVTHLKDDAKAYLQTTLTKFVYFPSNGILHPFDNSKPHFLLPSATGMQTLLTAILLSAKSAIQQHHPEEYWTATSKAFQAFSDAVTLDRLLKDQGGIHSRRILYLAAVGESLWKIRHKTDATQLKETEAFLRKVAKWYTSIGPLLHQATEHSNTAGRTVELAKGGCSDAHLLEFINSTRRGSGHPPIADLKMFLGEIRWELVRDNRNAQISELRASDEIRPPETSRFERHAAQWAAQTERKWPAHLDKLMQMAIDEKYNIKSNDNPGGENHHHLYACSSRLTFRPDDKESKAFKDGIPLICKEWVDWKVSQNNTIIERAIREYLLYSRMTMFDEAGNEIRHDNLRPITEVFTWTAMAIFGGNVYSHANKCSDVCPPKLFVNVNIEQIPRDKWVWFKGTGPDPKMFEAKVKEIARYLAAFIGRNFTRALYLFKFMNPVIQGLECLEAAHSKIHTAFGLDEDTMCVLLYAIMTGILTLSGNENSDHFARESMDIFTFKTDEPEPMHVVIDCDADAAPKPVDESLAAAAAAAAATLASLSQAEAPAAGALPQAEAPVAADGDDGDDDEEDSEENLGKSEPESEESEEGSESDDDEEESESDDDEEESESEEGEVRELSAKKTKKPKTPAKKTKEPKTPAKTPEKVATPDKAPQKAKNKTFMDVFNEEVYKNLHAFHVEELGPMPTDDGFAQTLLQKIRAASYTFFQSKVLKPTSRYVIAGSADTINHMINAWFLNDVSALPQYELSLALIPVVKEVTVLDLGRVTHQLRAIKNKIILEAYYDTAKHSKVPPQKATVDAQLTSLRALIAELKATPPVEGGAGGPQ